MAAGSLLGCTVGPLHFILVACLRTRTLGKCNTDRRSAVLGRAALYRKLDCSRAAAAAAAADSHGRLPPVGPEVAPPPSLSPALSLSLSLSLNTLSLALTLLHTLRALIRPPATLVRCFPSHPRPHRQHQHRRHSTLTTNLTAPITANVLRATLHICIRLSSLRRCPAPSLVPVCPR